MTPESLLKGRIQRLCLLLGLVAAINIFLLVRTENSNSWLLEPPLEVGAWKVVDTPLPQAYIARLAQPKAKGVEFQNPLDERVNCQLISVRSFESYREPDLFLTLGISAQRQLMIPGTDKPLRAWVLKVPRQQGRILTYAWLQNSEGQTSLFGEQGMEQSLLDRFRLGCASLWRRDDLCLVRLYTVIAPGDTNGAQARRNLDQVAKALYEHNIGGHR
jgi:hypothetical protein